MTETDNTPWQVNVATLFPDMFPGLLDKSIPGRALKNALWSLTITDIRDYAFGKHNTVDDTPAGGGAGMVMRADVIDNALYAMTDTPGPVIYLSPRGTVFNQETAAELSQLAGVKLLCGRYEGIDQRVLDKWNVREISMGDYVLSGGEPAAQTLLDACVRLLPGVLGSAESLEEESFANGLLEYPLYTRPVDWNNQKIPDVLLSGHHGNIAHWRLQQSQNITKAKRPDLWEIYQRKQSC